MTEYDDETLRTKTDEFLEFNQVLREYRLQEILPYTIRTPILDVGCGHIYMVQHLADPQRAVYGVDPDHEKLDRAERLVDNVVFLLGRLEDVHFDCRFGTIICSHVIEHTDDPFEFLKKAHWNLHKKSGILIVTCPNALSLHKRVGEIAGLSEPYKPSATDIMQGHKHIFDRLKLETLVRAAGFEIEVSKGIMLKPFPNAMMSDLVTRRFADALYEIGKDPALTDYCSSLLIVARPR